MSAIPKKILQEVMDRDEGICQICGKKAVNIHHVISAGLGGKRKHKVENLISLCGECHKWAHETAEGKQATIEWARVRYPEEIERLLYLKKFGKEREETQMNKFKKYCPNVWIAECEEEYEKGEIIKLETKYGKEVECEVYNFIGYTGTKEDPKYCYSIVRLEDKTYAERKLEKYQNAVVNSVNKSNEHYQAAQEAREFLSLGEPIKVGHHSEKRHRALIERNSNRMDKSIEYLKKAEEQKRKAEYWASRANDINLSMPESIEYYQYELEKAKAKQKGLKDGSIKKEHSYSLTYATKAVKDLTKKLEQANKLWG